MFEVEEVAAAPGSAASKAQAADVTDASLLGQEGIGIELAGRPAEEDSCSLWLAGHVEAFNIPGTNAQAGGLRFLPSCYRWQLTSVT